MIRLTKNDLSRALARDPLIIGRRAVPLFFRLLSYGWCVLVGSFFVSSFGSGTHGDAAVGIVILAVPAIVLAYLSTFLVNRLTIQLATRTYIWEHGIFPSIKRRRGTLDEFDYLELGRQRFQTADKHGYSEYSVPSLWLASKQGSDWTVELPDIAVFGRGGLGGVDRVEMWRLTESLAQKTGLPIRNAYLDRLPPSAPAGVWKAALAVFVLLICWATLYPVYMRQVSRPSMRLRQTMVKQSSHEPRAGAVLRSSAGSMPPEVRLSGGKPSYEIEHR